MIVDKKPSPIVPDVEDAIESTDTADASIFDGNPMVDVIEAILSILKDIPEDENNPDGPKLFKTVKANTGQLTRIRSSTANTESQFSFPAALAHLINVRWLVSTDRIGEGRADLRICYILNRLDYNDDEYQTECMKVFQRINTALNDNKNKFSVLTERLQLTYWDQVESFDDGLQQCWITYEVYFRDYSSYRYKNFVTRYLVVPPFTDHSDQNETANPNHLPDHKDISYKDVSTIANGKS
jgi:hypothetical protein